jgi:O-antigen/teichoic acid export membrane protein
LGGEEFLPHGAVALQLVIWSIPIGWMNSVTNYVLIALGVEKRLTNAFIAGVAFNIIANLIFLPRYSYIAASITTILSEVILLGLFALYLRPAMPDVLPPPPVRWRQATLQFGPTDGMASLVSKLIWARTLPTATGPAFL